jgi:exonuclease VII large subunit
MPARVYSIESIAAFRAALLKFRQRVEDALVELDGQMRRAVDWIEHDRPAHWRAQTKEAEAWIHEAKLDLERCLIYRVTDDRPACREERATLKKAQARREYCREKTERLRHWKRNLHHQLYEFQGRISKLSRMLEHDIPQADAALRHILRQLEAYQIERPPTVTQTGVESKAAENRPAATHARNTLANSPEEDDPSPQPHV